MMSHLQSLRNQISPKMDFTTIFSKCWATSMAILWARRGSSAGRAPFSPAAGAGVAARSSLVELVSFADAPIRTKPRCTPTPPAGEGGDPAPGKGAVQRLAAAKPGRRSGWEIKLPWAYPNRWALDLSIQEPGIRHFEHAYVRITWDNSVQKRWNWDIPGYPWDQRKGIPGYPDVYQVLLGYTTKIYPGISHYNNLVMGYPKTYFLSWLIPGYPWISCMSSYPGISHSTIL